MVELRHRLSIVRGSPGVFGLSFPLAFAFLVLRIFAAGWRAVWAAWESVGPV